MFDRDSGTNKGTEFFKYVTDEYCENFCPHGQWVDYPEDKRFVPSGGEVTPEVLKAVQEILDAVARMRAR